MAGSRPGSNSTSTTGPMTWTIFPVLMLRLLAYLFLTRLVELDRQDVDHLLGVLRRRLHRRHARAVFADQRLHEGLEDLRSHVPREQLVEDRLRIRLVEVVDRLGVLLA